MRDQLVTGADGREWTVRSQLEWRPPVTAEDFEHDVTGGSRPGYAMLALLAVLLAVVVIWMPDGVVVPNWFVLLLALVALIFPLRWVWRRPWTVVAETEGLDGVPETAHEVPATLERNDLVAEGNGDSAQSTVEATDDTENVEEYDPYPPERWVGTVRGMFAVRGHVSRTAKAIQRHSVPERTGPLRPID